MSVGQYLQTRSGRIIALSGLGIMLTSIRSLNRDPIFTTIVLASWVAIAVTGYLMAARDSE